MTGRTTLTIPATPPSLNTWLSKHWRTRDRDKKQWERVIYLAARLADLPFSERIDVEVTFRFRDRRKRDTGNYSSVLEKCLGDALRPGFLADDDAQRFWVRRAEIASEIGPAQTTIHLDWTTAEEMAA